jgi:large subunit ribosomal protein L20
MRVKGGFASRHHKKDILKRAKGFRGSMHARFAIAKERVMQAERYQYISRRLFKRDIRALWIQRINIAVRICDPEMNYSTFMHALKTLNIAVDRKVLAEMAVTEKEAFSKLVGLAKQSA